MKSSIKNKIIVILGPTASGKSDLAVKIAKKIGGEIISADSRQVYKGLNIGTGKITKKEKVGVPHYLLDVVSPKRKFTAAQYKKLAERAIEKIIEKKKIPIVCGGTGFYISTLLGNINIPEIKPNWKLRKQLKRKTTEQLFKILEKLNPKRAKTIDPHNPRRLIRAIEIAKTHTRVPKSQIPNTKSQILEIGIKLPEKELEQRIEKRIKKMIKNGLINEVKKLHLSRQKLSELGFEYKYPAMFLRGEISKEEMLERMLTENRQYAKRQMTWFKKYNPKTHWVKNYSEAEKIVKKFI